MPRLIALYHPPDDTDAFDAHYRDVHTPIVRALPEPPRRAPLEAGRRGRTRPAPFHLMAEMAFDSEADLDEALASEPGAESATDLRNFAGAGVTMFIAQTRPDA